MTKTRFDPQKPFDTAQDRHYRRSIRLPNHDYAQPGGYFITIVTYRRDLLFGEIVNAEMVLNDFGRITNECWHAIPEHFPNVELGAYMVMPNHVHGIIVIKDNITTTNSPLIVGARHVSPLPQPSKPHGFKRGSIGAIIGSFKAAVTRRIACEYNATGLWQRNYYEHVIRNDKDLRNKTDYINANPLLWDQDDENPLNIFP